MRCLTFSDLSLGSEFAGGCRGREQRCVELSLPLFKRCRPDLPLAPLPPLMGYEHTGRGVETERRQGRGVWACLIVCELSLETNYRFSSVLRRGIGRSHCGVKSLAKACVTPLNDRAESLTAAGRKHVNTLTDACYIERLWWLFSWLGFHCPPPPHLKSQYSAQGGKEIRTNLPSLLCNSLPRHEGHYVFVRWAQLSESQCLGDFCVCLFLAAF